METAVTNYNPNAFAAAASALAGDTKPILKCKKGDWYLGQDDEDVAIGTRVALNIVESEWGWLHWHDKKPDERRMVRVAAGTPIEKRSDLGSQDQDMWPTGDDGKPQDPWQKTIEIPGREIDGERREFNMSGSSAGFEGAVKKLFKQYAEESVANAGKVPIVELGRDKYKHRVYDIVKVPALTIVDWADPEKLEAGEVKPAKAKASTKF